MSARERILARVREALEGRPRTPHPGPFRGDRPLAPTSPPVEEFAALFVRSGGEVVRVAGRAAAASWLADFAAPFESVAWGATVPDWLRKHPRAENHKRAAPPECAALGVSCALGAVAETGSLVLGSPDGRRVQILPPCHVVVVDADRVHATLAGAIEAHRGELPSALALHSGPSKSADIGQVLVTGVHGPGRVVALVIQAPSSLPPDTPI